MNEYFYNSETFEYIGTGECQIDPLETEKAGAFVWLVSANATLAELPEEKEGYARVFDIYTKNWKYIEDYRGYEYWLSTDTWEDQPKIMKKLGPLPEGAVLEQPVKTTEEILNENWKSFRSIRNQKLNETDYLILNDYPISEELLSKIKIYRQELRDMPSKSGAPWDGGFEETPWPIKPEI